MCARRMLVCREQLQCQSDVIPLLPSTTHGATHFTWTTPARDWNVAGANVPRPTYNPLAKHKHPHTKGISQTPILKPAAVCSAPSPAAANSVSSFKSLPKALICSFSSAGRVPAPKPVNHPDELSASKQPLAPGVGNRKATTADQRADGEHNRSAIREKEMFAVLFE